MKELLFAAAALAGLLLAAPAGALNWSTRADCADANAAHNSIAPDRVRYWCPTDGAASASLAVGGAGMRCSWDADTTGTGSATVSVACDGATDFVFPAETSCDPADGNTKCSSRAFYPAAGCVMTPSAAAANGRMTCKGY